jgi:hypothetical protein
VSEFVGYLFINYKREDPPKPDDILDTFSLLAADESKFIFGVAATSGTPDLLFVVDAADSE